MVLGDNRQEKNLKEGAAGCKYAITVLSRNTSCSECAMEELSIIKSRYYKGEVTVFPVLFEISPSEIPVALGWIKEMIFKETNRRSGTREICNHIACKITGDIVINCVHQNIKDIISSDCLLVSSTIKLLLRSYTGVDNANLNSRIALLYATYLIIITSNTIQSDVATNMASMVFERLFSETRLNLSVDYRELWLLENCICILADSYLVACTESKM